MREWHTRERAANKQLSPLSAIVYVKRAIPAAPDRAQDFDVYAPNSDLRITQASLNAAGDVVLGADTSVTSGCGLSTATADIKRPAVSWDATKIAFAARSSAGEPLAIYEMNANGSGCVKHAEINAGQPTSNGLLVHNFNPQYSPVDADGKARLVFASTRGTSSPNFDYWAPQRTPADPTKPNSDLYVFEPDPQNPAANRIRQLTFQLNLDRYPAFMSDGRVILDTEKRAFNFYQLALRRINLDGGDSGDRPAGADDVLLNELWLVYILADVIIHGLGALHISLFFNDPAPAGVEGGGLRNAFIGQLMITLAATLIGVPVGVLGGTFLAEYARGKAIARIISIISDIMVSVPSIVIGAFVYALLVRPLHHFSGWAGAFALSIIMIPVVLRTTEDMLSLVPWTLREAAFALGAPYYKVIIQIVYRGAATGILTGILLSIARVAGETAPLLFTSFNNNFFSTDMNRPLASLTVTIFQYAMGPYQSWHSQAWGAALVITLFILMLTIAGRLILKWRYKQ